MSRSFTDYVAIVDFLTKTLGHPLDDALREAQIPLHLADQVSAYFRGPVEIDPPALLVQPQVIQLCRPLPDDQPQPYLTGFRTFLLNERRWRREVIEGLGTTSEELVCRFPEPAPGNAFQARGLVVGHIQSGKTATMAALIARAADQGYRLFIVLAGLIDDLRAQTQRRLDQEITGASDDWQHDAPLVNHDPGTARWIRLTRSGMDGEFHPGTVQIDLNPQTPKLAVVKKNVSILRKLIRWLAESPIPLSQLPALVIDDECDQASIDTNYGRVDDAGDDLDPSKTNAAIRDLLHVLPKCCYVGFTATPFANVLIDMTVEDDLYPRDFIASLPEPHGYFGPRQLFGLGMGPSELTLEPPEAPPLNALREITHEQLDILDRLTPDADCPEILSRALLAFVLSCCARLARGQEDQHFSMLVHPSQSTVDHMVFTAVVSQEIEFLKLAIARPRTFTGVVGRARELWETDFIPVSQSAAAEGAPIHDFATIWRFARTVADGIEIKTLNWNSRDTLDYSEPPKRYVVIGGNKLSRGLTLEGLSVSVFTRNTNTYDTLLQMGRWFGFRPGYHDLTRVFLEQRMSGLFADLARVELELRSDIRKYARQPNPPNPAELAPRIRAHPSMAVTSRLKMGAGRRIRPVNLEGSVRNTVNFPTDDRAALHANIAAGRAFIRSLGAPQVSRSPEGMHLWTDIAVEPVLGLVQSYVFGPGATVINRPTLTAYIQRVNERGELVLWDVVIPQGNPDRPPFQWTEGVGSRMVKRSPTARLSSSIGTLSSPNDLRLWRDATGRSLDDPTHGAVLLYLVDKDSGVNAKTGNVDLAFFRSQADAVDLLGITLVFPTSQARVVVDYLSQQDQ